MRVKAWDISYNQTRSALLCAPAYQLLVHLHPPLSLIHDQDAERHRLHAVAVVISAVEAQSSSSRSSVNNLLCVTESGVASISPVPTTTLVNSTTSTLSETTVITPLVTVTPSTSLLLVTSTAFQTQTVIFTVAGGTTTRTTTADFTPINQPTPKRRGE